MNINRLLLIICLFLSTVVNLFAQFPEEPPEFAWVKKTGGIGSVSSNDVVSDASGNIYVTGTMTGDVTIDGTTLSCTGREESYVAKYNASGNLVWIKQISCPEHETVISSGIAVDDIGNAYITGYYYATMVDFGSVILPASQEQDIFIAKYNTSGVLQWANRYGDIMDNQGSQITTDQSGNVYFIHSDGDLMNESSFIKYNTNGTFQWKKDIQASCRDLAAYNSNLYVTGGIFDYGSVVIGDTTIEATGKEVFIAKLDLNGNWDWVRVLVNKNELYRFVSLAVKSMEIDNNENIYLYGYYEEWIAFGTDTFSNPGEVMWFDIFLAKFNNAGNLQWLSGSGHTEDFGFSMRLPNDFTLDESGNPCLVGLYGEIAIFGNDTLPSGWAPFFCKYNSSGICLWGSVSERYTEKIHSYPGNELMFSNPGSELWIKIVDSDLQEVLEITTEGNTGTLGSMTIDKDPENNLFFGCFSSGETDMLGEKISGNNLLVGKSDPSGNLIWIKNFKRTGGVQPRNILGDKYGNCYVIGKFSDTLKLDGNDLICEAGGFYILKLTSSGELVWSEQFVATSESYPVPGIATDTSGNIIITGSFYDSLIVGADTLLTGGSMDIFIIKMDNQGNFLWTKSFGSPGGDICRGVSTAGNNIIITGDFSANIVFGETELIYEGGPNIFITKLDTDGAVIWAKQAGGSGNDQGYSVITDHEGNSYISGYSSNGDQISFDAITIYPNKTYQLFIAKYNSNGNAQWAEVMETDLFQPYPAYQSFLDNQGNIYVGGIFVDTLHIDESNKFYYEDGNTFVAKYASGGSLQWAKNFGLMNSTWSDNNIDLAVISENTIYAGGSMNAGKTSFDNITISSGRSCGILGLIGGVITVDSVSSTPVLCYGDSTGSITVSASSTTGSLMYSLDDGLTFQDSNIFDSIPAGDYQVKIKDASGLTTNADISVEQPDSITLTNVSADVDCHKGVLGSVDLTVTGGTGSYSYLWSNDSIQQDLSGLLKGTYAVLVTDDNGCTKTDSFNIGYSNPLEIDMQNSVEFCTGDSGVITAPAGYVSYEWSDMSSGSNELTVNTTGVYWVKVTAESGCTDTDTIIVTAKSKPVIEVQASSNPITMTENTILTATGAASYKWTPINKLDNPFNNIVTADPDTNTTYTVTGTGANGCKASKQIRIFVYCFSCGDVILFDEEGTLNHGCANNNYNNGANCSWTLYPSGAVNIYLQFSKFDIKPGDILKVYDGQNANGTLLGSYDNNNKPPYQIQAGNTMFIQFITDQSITGEGFTANFWTDQSSGLNDMPDDKQLIIYPNPFRGHTQIKFPDPVGEEYTLTVTDISGKVIKIIDNITEPLINLDFGGLSKGIYLLELRGSRIYRGKIVLE